MADQMRPTPRSFVLGLFSDIVNLPLQYMSSPERTQQMQGTAQFLYGTGIPKTLERMSYGDSLFSGASGLGGTTRMRPETAEALMNVAPLAPAVGRLANRAVKATEGLPVGMSIKDVGGKFNIASRDASDIFGVGSTRVRYTEPNSGSSIEVLTKPDGSASVLSLEVPEKFRGKRIGESLQAQVMQDFPVLQGQISSKAAAKTAYRLGRRPPNQPDASLEDVFKIIDENSSINMVSPAMQKQMSMPSFTYPQQAALDLAQQRAALPVEQGGLGLPANNTPEMRMLASGNELGWYHGTTGDITKFRPELLGETTGSQSAKKGFFFARDPQNPPPSMMVKSTDPEAIDFLKRLGIPEEEIAKLNQVSMQGHGAETASGYARIGGTRDYKEAMRKANAAERRGDWTEYEKQMQIAEDSEIKRMNYAQSIIAKYGEARDEMLDAIQKSIYSKQLPQAEAEVLDAKVKQLMPYGWYNSYSQPQLEALKKEIVNLVGEDVATPALKQIDNFKSIKAERALVEQSQEGGNVMPVALRYKNPMVYDFGGSSYRDQTYSDLVDQALRGGHDALILKNTFDPAGSPAKLIDVGVVFSPEQIRSRFAAFDPFRKDVATATAMGVALPDLMAQPVRQYELPQDTTPMYTDPFGNTIGSSIR